ncbi:MAG TPA: DoxX family protein [Flavitalea sp.]|nr:DoxX family protein [Flavitalea sp.]
MKKVFAVNNTSTAAGFALLAARLGIAGLMLTHGIPKLFMLFSGEPIQFPAIMGLSATASLGLAVFAEVFCSLLILTGFATRLAVIPLIITMLTAVTVIHAADPIAVKEPALLYTLSYVVLLIAGSGKFSLDSLLFSKKEYRHAHA